MKNLYVKPNTRILARLDGDTGARENNVFIKKVQTCQNLINTTKPENSKNPVGREPGNKNKRKTRTKIARRNEMIEK